MKVGAIDPDDKVYLLKIVESQIELRQQTSATAPGVCREAEATCFVTALAS